MKKVFAGIFAALTLLGPRFALADSVPLVVAPGGVVYGSAQKVAISSPAVVNIDTATWQMRALRGVKTSTITFADGTVLASTRSIGGSSTLAWGNLTGNLNNQTDLATSLSNVATSTASLKTSITNLGVSTGSLQTQATATGASTGTLQTSVTNLGASTGTLAAGLVSVGVSTAALSVSTASLQAQIYGLTPVSLSSGVTGTLPASNMVSTSAFTSSTQTFTAQQRFDSVAPSTFTHQINVGSMTVADLSISSFVITDANKKLKSFDLFGTANNWPGFQNFTSPSGINTVYGAVVATFTISSLNGVAGVLQTSGVGVVSTASVNLATQVTGNLPVANFCSGTGASATTFCRGDNTWATPATGASSSALAITTGSSAGFFGAPISTPTAVFVANKSQFILKLLGGTTVLMSLDNSSSTLQGNSFNSANQLVQLSAGDQYPAADGNLITNMNAANLVGNITLSSATFTSVNANNMYFVEGGSMNAVGTGTDGFYIYEPNRSVGNILLQVDGAADFSGRSGFQINSNGMWFKNIVAGSGPTFYIGMNGSKTNGITMNSNTSSLCSDLTSGCLTPPSMGWDTDPISGSGVIFDSLGHIYTGSARQKNALMAIGGSAVIGSGYPDNAPVPTNGLVLIGNQIGMGQVFIGTGTLIGGTTSQVSILANTANPYSLVIGVSTAAVQVTISTNGAVNVGALYPFISTITVLNVSTATVSSGYLTDALSLFSTLHTAGATYDSYWNHAQVNSSLGLGLGGYYYISASTGTTFDAGAIGGILRLGDSGSTQYFGYGNNTGSLTSGMGAGVAGVTFIGNVISTNTWTGQQIIKSSVTIIAPTTNTYALGITTSTNANAPGLYISTAGWTASDLFVGRGSTVTVVTGAGAGSVGTPTASVLGTNSAGTLTVNTATTPSATSTVATVTVSIAAPTQLVCVVTPANAVTALLSGATMVLVTETKSTWTVTSGASGLTGASTYVWDYLCGGY